MMRNGNNGIYLMVMRALCAQLFLLGAVWPAPALAVDTLCVEVVNQSDYVLGVERMSGDWSGANPATVLHKGASVEACATVGAGSEAELHWGAPLGVRIALVVRGGEEPEFFVTPDATPVLSANVVSGHRGDEESETWQCVFTSR